MVARFFIDLRQALRLTLPQAAHYVQVHPEVIETLETGQIEFLPPWAETARIVLTYPSMAGVDGASGAECYRRLIGRAGAAGAT